MVVAVPLLALGILLARPALDARWQNHPAHFWIVLGAAAIATALGWTITDAARRRRDGRLFLISLAFLASAGFLGLHALATPGVLVGPNVGFELATPLGLLLGGVFVGISGTELSAQTSRRLLARARPILGGLFGLMAVWAVVSVAELPPLDEPWTAEALDTWQLVIGSVGLIGYGAGAVGYLRLYRRRRTSFALMTALAFLLLAEAMVVIAFAANWRMSWWEWHVLMLAAFAVIAVAARREWHEERFAGLYLDQTLAGTAEVSILFADLEGFTPFSESHSPDDVARMLNAYFARLVPLVRDRGGDVHELIGDAIMAVFNKTGDQPDHARRAAEAGLALQALAEEIAATEPGWPRFRVGINSGEVVAGVIGADTGHRKHGVVGDTVNLAARLEHEARAGEVVIGEGTYERLPPRTSVERLPALSIKGKSDPVDAYVLRGLPD